jgi:nicotinamide mononucleotide transporter
MHWQEWYLLFLQQMKQTSLLEWIAVIMGVAEVLLARINNVLLYPAGILGTILGTYLYFNSGLYAESLLNVYYLVMSFYGWYYWIKKTNEPPVEISYSTAKEWLVTIAISLLGGLFLYFILKNFTSSTVPIWDAWVSSTAWAGMWLLARRKIENWVLLNISNIFAIPLCFHKGLALFGFLTIFFFVIGTWGFFDWRRIYRQEKLKRNLTLVS